MSRRACGTRAVAVDPYRVLYRVLLLGAGPAAVWLLALLAVPPAFASSEGGTTLLRSDEFSKESLSSMSKRPIRRRAPYGYHRSEQPYGFLNLGGGVFDPATQPGSGFYGVISAGSEVGQALDLGIQVSWYHRSSEGEQFFASYVDPAGNVVRQEILTQSVDTDLLPLMGIVRLKFPSPPFQPYVGGGAGYEWLFVEGVDNQGFAFSNDYGGFGAQAMAGVNLSASSMTALYAEAVYNFSTVHADFYDPVYNAVVRESLDFNGLAIHGGLRLRF
jgi:hypothetical protein